MELIQLPLQTEPPQGESSPRRECLPKAPRFVVGSIPVDCVSMKFSMLLLVEAILHRGKCPPLAVVASNAWVVTLAEQNETLREAVWAADLVLPDGMSVLLASRFLGARLPERVTGGDLMERMCAEAAHYGFRVFLLGGPPGVAVSAASNLCARFPGLNICGTYCPPPGFENDPAELRRMHGAINEASPDLLCVAFGAPKQEIWMRQNRSLNIGAMLAVGAALERQAGLQPRAPAWMQRLALEWMFRLMLEPRRLWRRYLLGNPRFLRLVLRQAWRERGSARDRGKSVPPQN